jgi:iron complex outermembrane receptor protein
MIQQVFAGSLLLAVVSAGPLAAQQSRADSARVDSIARLRAMQVTVTRGDEQARRLPWAVGVQTAEDVRRGQSTVGVDEALNNVPGVVVSNRYIFALDQRLSIRGAGSRANFGTRGVKVLLDGVPQSLPDGQSQLTNVELGTIGRIEVLRGAASSLYGNGSGGVISFETDMRAPDVLRQEFRYTGGSYDLNKWQLRTVGRTGNAIGSLSVSRTTLTGFRQYSGADVRQINAAVNYALGASSMLEFRANQAGVPFALNPGALTQAEWDANPDSAAAFNILRGAAREVGQRQYSIGYRTTTEGGTEMRAVAYGSTRTVDNALAVSPPAPAGPTNGTFASLYRRFLGARFDARRQLGADARAPRLAVGLDVQRSRDHRKNQRSSGGRPVATVDTLLLDQIEAVTSVGPFAQLSWTPNERWLTSAGARWDHLAFAVEDLFLQDGRDNTGDRTMTALSGHLGVSRVVTPDFVPYINVATAFETPTTTELQVSPDGSGGFNPALGPQRILTFETGARGGLGRMEYDISLFRSRTTDAIIQFAETNGRAFFQNAGSTQSTGAEVGLSAPLASWIDANIAYTWADYVFDEYRLVRGAVTDTLDGKTTAGVPANFVRLGLRSRWLGATVDADWTWSDKVWGNDANTVEVEDWGRGRLDLRVAYEGTIGGQRVAPFVAVNNLFDQQYVGSITLNGAGGRVREGAPRRNWYAGFELGWSVIK